jgi:hypothetical protein
MATKKKAPAKKTNKNFKDDRAAAEKGTYAGMKRVNKPKYK